MFIISEFENYREIRGQLQKVVEMLKNYPSEFFLAHSVNAVVDIEGPMTLFCATDIFFIVAEFEVWLAGESDCGIH